MILPLSNPVILLPSSLVSPNPPTSSFSSFASSYSFYYCLSFFSSFYSSSFSISFYSVCIISSSSSSIPSHTTPSLPNAFRRLSISLPPLPPLFLLRPFLLILPLLFFLVLLPSLLFHLHHFLLLFLHLLFLLLLDPPLRSSSSSGPSSEDRYHSFSKSTTPFITRKYFCSIRHHLMT